MHNTQVRSAQNSRFARIETRQAKVTEQNSKAVAVKSALVVDDNPEVRDILTRGLEVIGFQVQEAENGQQAYELFLKNRHHLVVTDFQMPVMNGFTLIKRIKAESPDTPVILVSGKILDDWSEIGGHAAVAKFLTKPFTLRELHQAALSAVQIKG